MTNLARIVLTASLLSASLANAATTYNINSFEAAGSTASGTITIDDSFLADKSGGKDGVLGFDWNFLDGSLAGLTVSLSDVTDFYWSDLNQATTDGVIDFSKTGVSLFNFDGHFDTYNLFSQLPFSETIVESDSGLSSFSYSHEVTLPAVSAVPVPAAIWLFGSGLAGLFATRRKSLKTAGI